MRSIEAICTVAQGGNLAFAHAQAERALDLNPRLESWILLAEDKAPLLFDPPPKRCRVLLLKDLKSPLANAAAFLAPCRGIAPNQILRPLLVRHLLLDRGIKSLLFMDPYLLPLPGGELFSRGVRAGGFGFCAPEPAERPEKIGWADSLHSWLGRALLSNTYFWISRSPVTEEFLTWWLNCILGKPRFFQDRNLKSGLPDSVYDWLKLEPADSRLAIPGRDRQPGMDFVRMGGGLIQFGEGRQGVGQPFSRFNNGVPIPHAMRELFAETVESPAKFPDPLATGRGSFFDWATRARPAGWVPILKKIQLSRPDLMALPDPQLLLWFCHHGWRELKMSEELASEIGRSF